jgi:hypothetical protein
MQTPRVTDLELFETGLNSLSVDDQRRFLLELCTYDGPSKYAMPSDEDIANLRSLLLEAAAPLYVADRSDAQSTRNQLLQAGIARTI